MFQLGHRKLRAFVTHGGLLSMFESVYHGIPLVTMPVFCDHDVNAAKAVADGYALKLELQELTADMLVKAILKVIHDERYRQAVKWVHTNNNTNILFHLGNNNIWASFVIWQTTPTFDAWSETHCARYSRLLDRICTTTQWRISPTNTKPTLEVCIYLYRTIIDSSHQLIYI